MAYQTESLADFIAEMNAANGTTLKLSDLIVGTPKVVQGTWQEFTTSRNTGIRVTGNTAQYQGTQTLVYDRLNLASLTVANLKGFQVSAVNVTSVHGLIPMLKYWTGIQFTTDDLQDTALVDNGDTTKTATLTAKPNSYGWVGSVALTVTKGGASLNDTIAVTDLSGLNYPTNSDQDTYGQLYLYPYDFTQFFNSIAAIGPGVLASADADALVTAIKNVDIGAGKALWNNDGAQTAWSLNGATVVSNGLNSASMPTNPLYKYVMAITLRSGVVTPAGTLYLHYNDPFDPNA